MTGSVGRKPVAWAGSVLLLAALAAAPPGASAEPEDSGSVIGEEGAPEIRLEVPTSIAFDPLSELTGAPAPAVEPGPTDAPWTDAQDFPTAVFDGRIGLTYGMGGSDGTDVSNLMLWYRASTDDWVDQEIALPGQRQAASFASIGYSELIMAGGWDENGDPSAGTYYYDDGSVEWVSQFDDLPEARAAAGSAAFGDGQFYVIGGCTTTDCTPVSDSVFVRDFWDDWTLAADYPVPVAYPSCGAWKDRIYCTGGNDGTEGISDSYVYDRGTDTWSPLPDPPTDSWGSKHAMIDGILLVNGGVQGGALTNNTFGYDVRAGEWIDLPNSNGATYRGAGGCVHEGGSDGPHRFLTVGGLDGSNTPVADAEYLPGFTACGDAFDVPVVERHSGGNRYGTAAAIANLYAEGQDTVIVATGEDFPDALAAAARAGSQETPILLTRPETLPGETEAELERISPQDVLVVGGTAAVSDDVMDLIKAASGADTVTRVSGTNRFETAAALAAEVEEADTVFIATGANFPDALAGGALAGTLDAPLLLVRANQLPDATAEQLERLSPESIVVLGGTASISDTVVTELGGYGSVQRISGANRWETAALVAAEYPEAQTVGVASGRTWPDALTGAARAGSIDVPLMLVNTTRVPAPTLDELHRLAPDAVELYGGTEAVSDDVVEALEALYD